MKKLSICIPTYNRKENLSMLQKKFILRALDLYSEIIQVIVTDNSDQDIAEDNKKQLDPRILYNKNTTNIGYSGNILKCIDLASAEYIWIISDDDEIIWEGFEELLTFFKLSVNENPDIIFAPVVTKNIYGEKIVVNNNTDWNCEKKCLFEEILSKRKIPFLFVACVIIRNDFIGTQINEISKINNDYLQVLIYLSKLNNNSEVMFLKTHLVEYKSNTKIRFSILQISNSIDYLVKYIYDNFSVIINSSRLYSEHLKWMLYHRAGINDIYNGDKDRWPLLCKIYHNLSFRNIALILLILLPKSIIRFFFISYYSFRDITKKNRYSFLLFYSNYLKYNQLFRKNTK